MSVRRCIILILREMLLLLFKNTSTMLPWKYYCAQHPAYWGLKPAHLLPIPNADAKWRRNTFSKILKCYLLIQIKKCIVWKKIALLSSTGLSKMALGRLPLAEDQPAVFKWHVLLINKGELTLPNLNLCQTHLFLHHLLLTALSRLSEALWLKRWVCCVVCARFDGLGFFSFWVYHILPVLLWHWHCVLP